MNRPKRLAVLRPDDPEKAVARAMEIMNRQDTGIITPEEANEEFQKVTDEQPYTFVGYFKAPSKNIFDGQGKIIGEVQRGDSFVNPESPKARRLLN